MWCNDFEINLRYPKIPGPPGTVAPGRHQLALSRYLERKRQCRAAQHRHEYRMRIDAMKQCYRRLTARTRLFIAGPKSEIRKHAKHIRLGSPSALR